MFAFAVTLSALFDLIEMIICFLDKLLVVMLSFNLVFWLELFMTFLKLCWWKALEKHSLF